MVNGVRFTLPKKSVVLVCLKCAKLRKPWQKNSNQNLVSMIYRDVRSGSMSLGEALDLPVDGDPAWLTFGIQPARRSLEKLPRFAD